MRNLYIFLRPFIRRMSIQPTAEIKGIEKPICKPLYYYVFKLGYSFYMLNFKPKFNLEKLGELEVGS